MASKKKLIQSSKTHIILEDYSFVLFIQQPQKKYMPQLLKFCRENSVKQNSSTIYEVDKNVQSLNSIEKLENDMKKEIHLYRFKNTLIKKCISNFENKGKLKVDFQNIFQGPNMLIAGNNLSNLPSLWKSLNSIPHIFFCGAIIEKTFYNHLDLEKAIHCIYNTTNPEMNHHEIMISRLIGTLKEASQLNLLTRDFEFKMSALSHFLGKING